MIFQQVCIASIRDKVRGMNVVLTKIKALYRASGLD